MEELLTRFSIHSHNEWLVGLVDSAIVVAVYFLFLFFHRSIADLLLKRFAAKIQIGSEESIFLSIDKFLKRMALFYAISLIIDNLPLPPKPSSFAQDGIYILLSFFCLAFLFDLINILTTHLGRWGAREFQPLFSKLAKTLMSAVALMIVMRHFNYDIWHIVTALGIGSLAIGLAAQPTLTNMIAGFTLLMDRPFRPGDHILLSSGNEGDVKQIGIRSTWIQTSDANILIVPNSELVSSRLVNFNYPNTQLAQKVKFLFEIDQNFDKLKGLLFQSCSGMEGVLENSLNVIFSNVIDGKVEVSVTYRLKNFSTADSNRDQIIDAVLKTLAPHQLHLADYTAFSRRPNS